MQSNSITFSGKPLPLLVSSDNAVRVLLASGKIGVLVEREDKARLIRLSDETIIKEGSDAYEGKSRIAARALRARVSVPYEPKMSNTAIKALERSVIDDRHLPAKERLTKEEREQLAARHHNEGDSKSLAMTLNAQYDRYNIAVKPADFDFEKPGEARRRYGTACPMFAI